MWVLIAPTDVPPGQDGRIMAGCSMDGRYVADESGCLRKKKAIDKVG